MDWQAYIALSIVGVAALWLGRRSWRIWRRAMTGGPISDCGNCPRADDAETGSPLVQLGEPKERNEDAR